MRQYAGLTPKANGASAPSSHSVLGRRPSTRHGGFAAFTLIELLVVITIIGILAAITLAISGGANRKAALDKSRADVQAIANALEQYKNVNDSYPPPGASNTVPYTTIRPFYTASRPSTNINGTLLEDPYGNSYQYSTNRSPVMKNPASFDVWSKGPDGADNSTDDIGNW